MSIASSFRSRWEAIAKAADATLGKGADARYVAMVKAADDIGLVLIEKAMIGGYQKCIQELREELERHKAVVENLHILSGSEK